MKKEAMKKRVLYKKKRDILSALFVMSFLPICLPVYKLLSSSTSIMSKFSALFILAVPAFLASGIFIS